MLEITSFPGTFGERTLRSLTVECILATPRTAQLRAEYIVV